MPITILDLALFRGAKEDENGCMSFGEINRVGLPGMWGCVNCGATVAAYNACPSKSGYLKCLNGCIGGDGWDTVEDCDKELFSEDPEDSF